MAQLIIPTEVQKVYTNKTKLFRSGEPLAILSFNHTRSCIKIYHIVSSTRSNLSILADSCTVLIYPIVRVRAVNTHLISPVQEIHAWITQSTLSIVGWLQSLTIRWISQTQWTIGWWRTWGTARAWRIVWARVTSVSDLWAWLADLGWVHSISTVTFLAFTRVSKTDTCYESQSVVC